MIYAYSCRPAGAEWHLVVFAATGNRARLLAYHAGPNGKDDSYLDWRVHRLPRADGLHAGEAAWTCAADAPEPVRAQAAELWQEEDWIPRPRRPVAVECLDTGERYDSMTAAARAAYVTPQRMAVVLASGGTANGRRYRRVT
jgi:hypothetical protein